MSHVPVSVVCANVECMFRDRGYVRVHSVQERDADAARTYAYDEAHSARHYVAALVAEHDAAAEPLRKRVAQLLGVPSFAECLGASAHQRAAWPALVLVFARSASRAALPANVRGLVAETWCAREFAYAYAKHVLTQPHARMTRAECQSELVARYGATILADLPVLFTSDVAARHYALEARDIVRIERFDPSLGRALYYRRVVQHTHNV